LPETLAEAKKHADALAIKLDKSERARKKAEADVAAVEDLRKRLHDAETSLSDNIAQQSAHEKEILTRLEPQSRRFVSKYSDPCYFFGSSYLSLLAFS
jgi:septal ring factor EnvC (AmiA/AmiB activator)